MPHSVSRPEHGGPAPPTRAIKAELAETRARLLAAERRGEGLQEALQAAVDRERMLSHDLQHRVRNMLSVIRSIYRLTRESGATPEEFAEHFEGRLDVIARYQSNLLELRQGGVELEDVIRDELLSVHWAEGPGLSVAGPSVRLRDKPLELMALAVHELTTNAVKFGALYHKGSLGIAWTLSGAPPRCVLHLRWIETGVPLLTAAPRPRGFGRQLIEEALPYQLGATTSFTLRPGELDCSIALPLTQADPIEEADRRPGGDDEPFLLSETE